MIQYQTLFRCNLCGAERHEPTLADPPDGWIEMETWPKPERDDDDTTGDEATGDDGRLIFCGWSCAATYAVEQATPRVKQ